MTQHRVPVIREVATADGFALIGGYPAWFLGRLLTGYPGGLEQLLVRSGLPAERRGDILRAVGALVHVGGRWRLEHDAGSGSGTAPSGVADPHASSKRDGFSFPIHENGDAPTSREASPFLGTSEVASVLGVSPRMVRRLASTGALPGQRDAGGRWQFAAADVAVERARRMSARDAA